MWRPLMPFLFIATLGSCGNRGEPVARLNLTSTAFAPGAPIPAAYTCDGEGRPPPLAWSAPPATAKSFALVVDDPDAPGGTFGHWAWYDIPPDARSDEPRTRGREAVNDFGKPGYGPPCPPRGARAHRYRFKLYALGVARLDVGVSPLVGAVDSTARRDAIAIGEIAGTYRRPG